MKKDDVDIGQPVPVLTAEELHLAFAAGSAVVHGKSPALDLSAVFRPVQVAGDVYAFRDDDMGNQMAAAILESMKHDPPKAKAALESTERRRART